MFTVSHRIELEWNSSFFFFIIIIIIVFKIAVVVFIIFIVIVVVIVIVVIVVVIVVVQISLTDRGLSFQSVVNFRSSFRVVAIDVSEAVDLLVRRVLAALLQFAALGVNHHPAVVAIEVEPIGAE